MVEYIACPSCGRTLFNLETVLHEVREATKHIPGLSIAVMGCIVNGPGEMADEITSVNVISKDKLNVCIRIKRSSNAHDNYTDGRKIVLVVSRMDSNEVRKFDKSYC